MAQFPGAIDIRNLSDADVVQLTGAPASTPSAPATAAPIDINSLNDAQIAHLTRGHKAEVPTGEAAARLFYKHLTFGTEPFADKERSKQAGEESPFLNIGMAVPAMVAQTAALGPLAAAGKGVQGAGLAARTARGLGSAAEVALLPNAEAKTVLETARTGAKLGGNYSALEAAGSGLTDPSKSASDVARDMAISYGVGSVAGAGLGVGAHGLSRGVGALANRTIPQLSDALAAARSPEAQGLKDFVKHAGYDDADLAKLRSTMELAQHDPAVAARYADLNVLEALKAGRLKPTSTGELKPEVITTRNLDDLAKHAANTEGRGQNVAAEAFGARKNEMSAKMQADIDQFFGSGNREGDASAIEARRAAIGRRYDKLKDSNKLVQVDELGKMQQVSPVFDKALQYAAQNDAIANPGSQWASLWSGGKLGDTVVTLSPSNMLDIHHALVMNAKPPIGGPTSESVMAGKLKSWFTDWADKNFAKHKGLREDYAQLRRVMDATEKGSDMPIALGGRDHPSLTFFREQSAKAKQADDLLTKRKTAYALAAQSGAPQKSLDAFKGLATKAEKVADQRRELVDAWVKARGEALKQFLAERGDNGPSQLVKSLTTQEGKQRLIEMLGPEKARAYIESLYNKANQQRLGNTLYGGSDTAFKLQKKEGMDALWRMATGAMHLRPTEVWSGARDMLSSAYRQRNADMLNEAMSRQGPGEVKNLLDTALAQQSLATTAHPYVRNPLLNGLGAVGASDTVKPLVNRKREAARR